MLESKSSHPLPPTSRLITPLAHFFTAPNLLTYFRILSVPLIVFLFHGKLQASNYIWGSIVFSLALITDFFDGFLARRTQNITLVGKLLDPMADKLVVTTGLLILVGLHQISTIVAIILIGREIVVSALRSFASAEGLMLGSSLIGRIKVFAQGFGIAFLMVAPSNWGGWPWQMLGMISIYLAVVLALWSAGDYFYQFFRGHIKSIR